MTNELRSTTISDETSPQGLPLRNGPVAAFNPVPEFDEFGNPPLTSGLAVLEMPGRWHVAACRAKHVKAYARDLLRMSRLYDGAIGYMLPMETITVRSACRHRRRYRSPMFPGLIFVCVADDSIELDPNHRTLPSYGISIPESAQQKFRHELNEVELFCLKAPDSVSLWPGVKEGMQVRILTGPFMGYVATVITLDDGRRKMVAVIETLGQAVTVDLSPDVQVEPVD